MTDMPTVSVILYGYNSAQFVERTIASLLAQDYPKVEFYFSDDGSSDGSFEIMSRACASSSRPITLHQNPTNLGICNQINQGVARTTGSLVMLANADDLYPVHYISRLVQAWQSRTPHPTVVWGQLVQIDEDDQPRGIVLAQRTSGDTLSGRIRGRASGPGATGVLLDRRVFTEFGPLPDNLMLEDSCLAARAFILGEPLHLDEPLVKYRVHDGNISQTYKVVQFEDWKRRRRPRLLWQSTQGHRAFVEMLRDLHQRPADNSDADEVKRARWVTIEKIFETALWRDYYTEDRTLTLRQRWAIIARLAKLQLKLTLRKWIPYLDERGARWEYQHYVRPMS